MIDALPPPISTLVCHSMVTRRPEVHDSSSGTGSFRWRGKYDLHVELANFRFLEIEEQCDRLTGADFDLVETVRLEKTPSSSGTVIAYQLPERTASTR